MGNVAQEIECIEERARDGDGEMQVFFRRDILWLCSIAKTSYIQAEAAINEIERLQKRVVELEAADFRADAVRACVASEDRARTAEKRVAELEAIVDEARAAARYCFQSARADGVPMAYEAERWPWLQEAAKAGGA